MITKEFRLSVIVPVYNAEKYIEKCARSLFAQDLKGIQFIFINDASPDGSMFLLKKIIEKEYIALKENILLINLEKNGGVSHVRNVGLSLATGFYITFCDSDDWIDANMYSSLYSLAEKEQADIAACDFVNEYTDHRTIIHQPYSMDMDQNLRALLIGNIFPSLWNSIVRRTLYTENNIQFPEGMNMGEDLAVNVRLYTYAQKIGYKSNPYYHYRHYMESACMVRSLTSIESDIKVATSIESFLSFQGLLPSFNKEVLYRKFFAKLPLWTIQQHRNYARWLATFPETNKYIWSYSRLNWKMKLEYWLAAKGHPKLANRLVFLLLFQHNMKNRIKKIPEF